MLKHLTKEMNFDEEIKEGSVIVDFFATWCGPCKMLGTVLEELSKEREDIKILKIDTDEFSELAMKFGVMSIPTILFYKDGEIINKNIGFCDKEKLLSLLEK
jgi:thioredoxin 1